MRPTAARRFAGRLCLRAVSLFVAWVVVLGCRRDGGSDAVRGGVDAAFDRELGARIYRDHCSACHGSEGAGHGVVRGDTAPPPLERAPWISGSPERLVRIVLHGLHGPVEIHGRTYDLQMPGFGAILDDAGVAAVLSHVRQRFAGASPVREALVRRTRREHSSRESYWHVRELEAR